MDLLRHIIVHSAADDRSSVNPATPLPCGNSAGDLHCSKSLLVSDHRAPNSSLDINQGNDYVSQTAYAIDCDVPSVSENREGELFDTTPFQPDHANHSSTIDAGVPCNRSQRFQDTPYNFHGTAKRPKQQKKNRICFFWYHFKYCDRDPANPKRPGETFPFIHTLDTGRQDIKLAKFPAWRHPKDPCGLALCPRRATSWVPQSESLEKEKEKSKSKDPRIDLRSMKNVHGAKGESTIATKKRTAPIRHRDDPAQGTAKRHKMDYDEKSTSSTRSQGDEDICFFWYHGHYARSMGARNNYKCQFKHDLSDSPRMVRPPPGYVHSKPCSLEWCPGDASVSASGRKGSHPMGKGQWEASKDCVQGGIADAGLLKGSTKNPELDDSQDWYLSGFDDDN